MLESIKRLFSTTLDKIRNNPVTIFFTRHYKTIIAFTLIYIFLFASIFSFTFISVFYSLISYSPDLHFSYPLFFDFTRGVQEPSCVIPLLGQYNLFKKRDTSVLLKDIVIEMELPETQQNIDAGMFMISLEMINSANDTIFHSHRPHMLKYKGNTLYEHAETIAYLPLYLIGFKEFKQKTRLSMLVKSDTVQIATLNELLTTVVKLVAKVSNSAVQIYNAELHITSEVVGWRYFTYHHPYITLFILVPIIAIIEAASLFFFMIMILVYWKYRGQPPPPTKKLKKKKKEEPLFDNTLLTDNIDETDNIKIDETDNVKIEKEMKTLRKRKKNNL